MIEIQNYYEKRCEAKIVLLRVAKKLKKQNNLTLSRLAQEYSNEQMDLVRIGIKIPIIIATTTHSKEDYWTITLYKDKKKFDVKINPKKLDNLSDFS